jgi:hypothetical protein
LQDLIKKAQLNYKCNIDGSIMEDEFSKVVCLRTEEGQTISITQVVKENEIETEYERLT